MTRQIGDQYGAWRFDSHSVFEAGVIYMDPLLFEIDSPQATSSASVTALPQARTLAVRARGHMVVCRSQRWPCVTPMCCA
jgi:hypothetical protein